MTPLQCLFSNEKDLNVIKDKLVKQSNCCSPAVLANKTTFDEGFGQKRQLYFYFVLEFYCVILYLFDSTLRTSILQSFLFLVTVANG